MSSNSTSRNDAIVWSIVALAVLVFIAIVAAGVYWRRRQAEAASEWVPTPFGAVPRTFRDDVGNLYVRDDYR